MDEREAAGKPELPVGGGAGLPARRPAERANRNFFDVGDAHGGRLDGR
jgi:hypothetical protein